MVKKWYDLDPIETEGVEMAKQQIKLGMKNKSSVANLVRLLADIVLGIWMCWLMSQILGK